MRGDSFKQENRVKARDEIARRTALFDVSGIPTPAGAIKRAALPPMITFSGA